MIPFMQRDKELAPLYENLATLIDSIEDCLTKRRILPCLILLYAGIDSISALENGQGRSAFKSWVDRYMLSKASTLGCNASDLYAARCGILHRFSAESNLSRDGQARPIMYAWGTGNAQDLARAGVLLQRKEYALHIGELLRAFRDGLADYLEELASDKQRQQTVLANAGIWLTNTSMDVVNDFLGLYDSRPRRNETS